MPVFGAPTVSVTAASMARQSVAGVGVQAGRHVHGEHGNFRLVDRGDEFFPGVVEGRFRPMPNSPSMTSAGFRRSDNSSRCRFHIWRGDVEPFNVAAVEVFGGGAGVVAVVARAGEDENQVVGASEFAGASGDFFADATMTSSSVRPEAQVAFPSRAFARR